MLTSKESHAKLPSHEAALDKTGKVPSTYYKTVWLSIETDVTIQLLGNI